MSITPEWISAITSSIAAGGVLLAFQQLLLSKNIAQLDFEDGLAKEYREFIGDRNLPARALLGKVLTDAEYEKAFDELFRYIDLTNTQISLRQKKRIGKETWQSWSSGIQVNLGLPAFERAWTEIKSNSTHFAELRRLEKDGFKGDPADWKNA